MAEAFSQSVGQSVSHSTSYCDGKDRQGREEGLGRKHRETEREDQHKEWRKLARIIDTNQSTTKKGEVRTQLRNK